ncbi:hypothetical protein DL89DRAFT_271220 [Linderina pennispora]|uniref:Uncharacterized protein n=1 Tax=Linderina pennispora TaxID=61395 RepID=A0A1Y1VVF6_9FUNG|nr:uncharacterized protein DL89DRAFT_271220 [Linderina pennispora]ORX65260.1 hypothetical protein DL89DRAFT_271220 [Linderina pennispora]
MWWPPTISASYSCSGEGTRFGRPISPPQARCKCDSHENLFSFSSAINGDGMNILAQCLPPQHMNKNTFPVCCGIHVYPATGSY